MQKINSNYSENKAKRIIQKCIWQNEIFKKYYKQKNWNAFHRSHYDWWAFPINQMSSYKDQYKVSDSQQSIMKKSQRFLDALKTNAIMVCYAWGYDLQQEKLINSQDKDQRWQNWPIRLYKMTKSLQTFGLEKYYFNALKYGNILLDKNYEISYGKRNFKAYFREQYKILSAQSQKLGQKQQEIQKYKNQRQIQNGKKQENNNNQNIKQKKGLGSIIKDAVSSCLPSRKTIEYPNQKL